MNIFSGLSAFPITPMTPEGQVIASDLARLVHRIEEGGADSVGLLGSTGAYMFLSREERRRAVVAAVGSVASIPVIVGVGAMLLPGGIAPLGDESPAAIAFWSAAMIVASMKHIWSGVSNGSRPCIDCSNPTAPFGWPLAMNIRKPRAC